MNESLAMHLSCQNHNLHNLKNYLNEDMLYSDAYS